MYKFFLHYVLHINAPLKWAATGAGIVTGNSRTYKLTPSRVARSGADPSPPFQAKYKHPSAFTQNK